MYLISIYCNAWRNRPTLATSSSRRSSIATIRASGPERVIDAVEERAPDGFAHLDQVASHAELEAIVKGYSKMADFDQTQMNRSKQVGMFEASQPGDS